MGGGTPRATHQAPPAAPPRFRYSRPASVIPAPPPRHFCAPPSPFLRPLPVISRPTSVIPAQAGTRRPPNLERAAPSPAPPATHAASPPNKPKQIRTNPNTANRPDQIGAPPGSPPNTPKRNNPEHERPPPLNTTLFPNHPSPLKGGRLGGGWNAASRAPSPARSAAPLPSFLHLFLRHSCAPPSVIPAQAGTRATASAHPDPRRPARAPPIVGRGTSCVVRGRFLPAQE